MFRCFIITYLVLYTKFCLSQSISDTILHNTINKNYLEQLIKIKIDSVRIKNKRTILKEDSILYLASAHHAQYLMENNLLSHNEKKKETKTPQFRVTFFGAKNHIVGENIAYTFINEVLIDKKGKQYINKTYEDLANDFVKMWVNSSGHYANIIKPEYTLTAVAIAFNEKTNKVFAVQTFSYRDTR